MKSFINVRSFLPDLYSRIGSSWLTNIPKCFLSIMRTGSPTQIKLMAMLLGLAKVLSSSCHGPLELEAKNNYFSTSALLERLRRHGMYCNVPSDHNSPCCHWGNDQ